ncbi:MAG: methionine biosynthesis protein MetW [Hyphomonadaceae bacterium]|nr:methionine biosynthesis protein MetW [Hyphomonadaceae bacterium]
MAEALRALPVLELTSPPLRPDHGVIVTMVSEKARVLDVGCGEGHLLTLLQRERAVRARGFDLNQNAVNACVAKGITAVQGDADRDLSAFPDGAFDYVIFSKTIQMMRRPRQVLKQAARIGERIIVSFANYGQLGARLRFLQQGRVSRPRGISAHWAETDLIHPCSVRDFAELAADMHLRIERAVPLTRGHPGAPFAKSLWRANLFADEAVFVLTT